MTILDGRGGTSAASANTATGLPPSVAAALSYAAWWLTGALFLAIEPVQPFVRFHARQAFIVFGALWLLGSAISLLSFAVIFVSSTAFRILSVFPLVIWGVAAVLWVACIVQAARGRWWVVPGLKGRFRTAPPEQAQKSN